MAARVEKARVPSSLYVCFKLFLGFGFDKNLYICLQFAMVCLFSMFVLVLVGTGVLVRTTPWRSNWSWCVLVRIGTARFIRTYLIIFGCLCFQLYLFVTFLVLCLTTLM